MKKKLRVGILGATGMVGQRLITLLAKHPWFEVVSVAASPNSASKRYGNVVKSKWKMSSPLPAKVKNLVIRAVEEDLEKIAGEVDFVFCALDMDKDKIREIENLYASADIPVVSNNSANRWTDDVPMILPEINPEHVALIDIQRKKRGWKRGLIAVKPNCSIQSYVSILTALKKFEPKIVEVTSMQAISGVGKTFETWPEMVDNLNPFISGEEEKSEKEPMKIWGKIVGNKIVPAKKPSISATCVRVPVADGHTASVLVSFVKKATKAQLLSAIIHYANPIAKLSLPSAPKQLIHYFEENDRPQSRLDRNFGHGMGISMGRLRPGKHFDWEFVALSHNTIRGAAGGAVPMAELLTKKGYIS